VSWDAASRLPQTKKANIAPRYVVARIVLEKYVFDNFTFLFTTRGNAVMHAYINAMNLGLPINPNAMNLGLPIKPNVYLDVEYEVENSQVVLKSVRCYGADIELTPVISEDIRLTLAQQIQDRLEFGY
jgi:hypothetical protein